VYCADFGTGSFAHEKRVVWVLHIKKKKMFGFSVWLASSVVVVVVVFLFFGGVRVPSVYFASSLNFVCQNTVIIN